MLLGTTVFVEFHASFTFHASWMESVNRVRFFVTDAPVINC